jgi:hypothetical protein
MVGAAAGEADQADQASGAGENGKPEGAGR